MPAESRKRIERLLAASRVIADAESAPGRAARVGLLSSTGLSREGLELALAQSLELHPSDTELETLASRVTSAPRAHVILSSTVFTAVHRALALALSASPRVFVKPSRREPEMARRIHDLAPELFTIVETISPAQGDAVFAYGTAETLAHVRASLPEGVWLSAHGPGFGLVVAEAEALRDAARQRRAAEALALDVAVFDQRGCLSPRLVLVEAERELALGFGAAAAEALALLTERVPLGRLSHEEQAEIARFRDTAALAGDVFAAGPGWVGVAERGAPLALAPVGRNLLVVPVANAFEQTLRIQEYVTTFAALGTAEFTAAVATALPRARRAALGTLQAPPLDGPVDLRSGPERIGG